MGGLGRLCLLQTTQPARCTRYKGYVHQSNHAPAALQAEAFSVQVLIWRETINQCTVSFPVPTFIAQSQHGLSSLSVFGMNFSTLVSSARSLLRPLSVPNCSAPSVKTQHSSRRGDAVKHQTGLTFGDHSVENVLQLVGCDFHFL